KSNAWREIVSINALYDAIVDASDAGKVIGRIAGHDDAPERNSRERTDSRWLVQRGIESANPALSVIWWRIKLIAQSKIHSELPRKFPVVLNKKAVVRRAEVAIRQSDSKRSELAVPGEKIAKGSKVDLTISIGVSCRLPTNMANLTAKPDAVLSPLQRKEVSQRY